MKDQVLRILRMVRDGRLSPDDALDLLDAFIGFDTLEHGQRIESEETTSSTAHHVSAEQDSKEDPFRKFIDSVEKMTRETIDAVNWKEVAQSVREAAKKGAEAAKVRVEMIGKKGFSFGWFGPTEIKTVELPLRVMGGNRIKVQRSRGDIKVIGGHSVASLSTTATLRGVSKDDARTRANRYTPIIEENDGTITLAQSVDTVAEDIELRVPSGVAIEVDSGSGDISVLDTHASVQIDIKSGDVNLRGVADEVEVSCYSGDIRVDHSELGALQIESKSGDIELNKVQGDLNLKASAGDVKARDIRSDFVTVESIAGDIDLDFEDAFSGSLNCRSVSGDILVDVRYGSDARVSVSSISGSVHANGELLDEHRTKERITGKLCNGKGNLDISSVSGDVTLTVRRD